MSEPSDKSRVLTLVFTDLADSTALKREKGDDAADALITRHRDHVVRLSEESSGRVIDWAGDGCFLTFETSSAAVMFALRLQQAHSEEPDLPAVRVGVHMGEVTEKIGHDGNTQIKGLAVDIAARVQSLARPGQVLLSAAVYDSARQRIGVDALGEPVLWQTHGAYTLKGFDKPLDIGEAGFEGLSPLEAPEASEKAYPLVPVSAPVETLDVEVMPEGQSSSVRRYVTIALFFAAIIGVTLGTDYIAGLMTKDDATEPSANAGPIRSLAVLPLDNLSNDSEQEYFADGMTEAITAELAKIKALSVISRTSVMRYKDTTLSMPEIAAELGVQGLIEGSVLRDGDEVRITVQLIDGRTDRHVWSESYTDTITSVLKLQARVALEIAEEIRATVTPEEQQRIASARLVNDEAYDAYLKAWELISVATEESITRALEYLKRAQEIDPEMAAAWGAEARAHWQLSTAENWPMREQIDKVRIAASRALALDETQFYGHVGMGSYAQVHDRDWDTAVRHFKRAVELNPSEPLAYFYLGNLYVLIGDWQNGLAQAEEIIRLSHPTAYERSLASVIFFNTNESNRGLEVLKDLNIADIPRLPWQLAQNYLRAGDVEKALRQSRSIGHLGLEAVALAQGGQHEQALEVIERIRRADETTARPSARETDVATAYIWMGGLDNAFLHIERADANLANWVLGLLREPYLDGRLNDSRWMAFRSDPRYWKLIERLKLPPLPPEHPGYADEQAWLARKAVAAAADAPIEKIAVLPFDNMSSDPEQEYFVDGMTEALIAELAKIKSIKVISRTSIMQYKDTDKSLPEIARELGVDALIEGSVMKSENDVRITAQLIHGITDEHLWAESYTNTLENVFKLQAEVALSIADEISAVVTPEERSRIADTDTVDPEAYRLYAQGRQFWNRRTFDGFTKALDLFERAVEIDNDFALAHAGIADVYVLMPVYGSDQPALAISKAIAAAERALDIDPNLGEAYTSLGYAKMTYWDRVGAEADLRKAIDLNPSHAIAHAWLAIFFSLDGRVDEALEHGETAYQLDPLSSVVTGAYGLQLQLAGKVEASLRHFEETARLHSGAGAFQYYRGVTTMETGDVEAAVRYFDSASALTENEILLYDGFGAAAHAMAGDLDFARETLERLIQEQTNGKDVSGPIVLVFAALGDTESAFQWLERGVDRRDSTVSLVEMGKTFLGAMVSDPRYQDFLRQTNLLFVETTN